MMFLDRIAVIVAFANRNFNSGLRAYYFGVAALSWFLHPALAKVVATEGWKNGQ